ncbi:MAG TPA: hypothetical protein VGO57_09005 [Verrucomicrobiae bacterium]|jgi:hypothetical protein
MKIRFSKLIWLIAGGLIIIGIVAFLLIQPERGAVQAVAKIRESLRQQGFKTDLSDFNFSTSDELRSRMAELNAVQSALGSGAFVDYPDLMKPLDTNTALVIWQQGFPRTGAGQVLWPALREAILEQQSELDEARAAILSGPIEFNLDARSGNAMLLPHLAVLKNLALHFGSRAVLAVHDGNQGAAWTNLLAETRLVTAWKTEPVEISQLVRFDLTTIAYSATWQMLQTNGWSDESLARLQHEWEATDFLTNLPETIAFKRACQVNQCRLERARPISSGLTAADFFKELMRSPHDAWLELNGNWKQICYHAYGTYVDEKDLLIFYRDREIEFRNAVQKSTWSQMQSLPGVTNNIFFQSKFASRLSALMNLHEMNLAFMKFKSSFLGRAAEAEARRRILITAIALERYCGKHGVYPKSLAGLVPEFLNTVPLDFMDGQPLRYHLTDNGRFILYSIGDNGVDDDGQIQTRKQRRENDRESLSSDRLIQSDIVWPQAATPGEMADAERQSQIARANETDEQEELQTTTQWDHTAQRQAEVEKLLTIPMVTFTNLPVYSGHLLIEILHNENSSGTNKLSLRVLLTLHQIITGAEPETVTFETPIAFDALTNIGMLQLYVDPALDANSDEGCMAVQCECDRATNGDCLLAWSTIYECPGKHALQAGLRLNDPSVNNPDIDGPISPFVISNLCQFSLTSSHFDPETGAMFRVKLPEQNGRYHIDLKTTDGVLLKSINGTTATGIIKEHWNLMNNDGQRFTNDFFNSVFHITLPDSGRSQTLNGP